ncbi:MAG: hypothetical protein PVI90_09395 [Desulfobacteraceae bacterium]
MNEANRLEIHAYLTALFLPEAPEKLQDKEEKVQKFVQRQAESYAVFVDTESDGWRTIVEGLICGWALKQICRKIRGKDYKSVIGGRSLAKYTPAQLRTLSMDLLNKAERAGTSAWNIQPALEQIFKWSQKNPHTPQVVLFMDAVSLGFMRFDKFEKEEKTDTRNNEKIIYGNSSYPTNWRTGAFS